MDTIAVLLVSIFAAYIFKNYWLLLYMAKHYGIETEAYVSRIEQEVRHAGGADFPTCFYYVTFHRQDGLLNEARLLNPKRTLHRGSRVLVRYRPDKNNVAFLASVTEAAPAKMKLISGR